MKLCNRFYQIPFARKFGRGNANVIYLIVRRLFYCIFHNTENKQIVKKNLKKYCVLSHDQPEEKTIF